jgi:hypothetical protein
MYVQGYPPVKVAFGRKVDACGAAAGLGPARPERLPSPDGWSMGEEGRRKDTA